MGKFAMGVVKVIRVKLLESGVAFVDVAVQTDVGLIALPGFRVGISAKSDKPYVFLPDSVQTERKGKKVTVKMGKNGYPLTNDVVFCIDEDDLGDVDYSFQAKVKKGITNKLKKLVVGAFTEANKSEDTNSDSDSDDNDDPDDSGVDMG